MALAEAATRGPQLPLSSILGLDRPELRVALAMPGLCERARFELNRFQPCDACQQGNVQHGPDRPPFMQVMKQRAFAAQRLGPFVAAHTTTVRDHAVLSRYPPAGRIHCNTIPECAPLRTA